MAKKNKYFVKKENIVKKKCSACNGSGHYDNTGSPECSSCSGTGYEKENS